MGVFSKMLEMNLNELKIMAGESPFKEADWVSEAMRKEGHEKMHFARDPETKLRAVIAIHDRTLGKQALGGIRMLPYPNEKSAILDVLRLSKAMTYKAAVAGVEKGGAKCVVWGDAQQDKTPALLEKLAEEIERLSGEYIGGEDMNVGENDLVIMSEKTSFLAGLPKTYQKGQYRGCGDPSPVTARGIIYGMKACLRFMNMGDLSGKTVAIQGLGKVGRSLAVFLLEEGAKQIIGTDIDLEKMVFFKQLGRTVKAVKPGEIFSQKCDILAPCAAGGIINRGVIPLLGCKIIAGAANNQLQSPRDGKSLWRKNILYAPDYVINAGGLINVDDERHPLGYNEQRVQEKLGNIFHNLLKIFWYSERLNLPANLVADMMAEEKIQIKKIAR